MEYSLAGGKLIHEKNQKQKISWHCPFKGDFLDCSFSMYVIQRCFIYLIYHVSEDAGIE